jgi:hypothetical protein
MALLAWIISIGTFLGGLAVQADMRVPPSGIIAGGLFVASVLSCPILWENWVASAMLSGKERMMGCVALMLALPLVLLH